MIIAVVQMQAPDQGLVVLEVEVLGRKYVEQKSSKIMLLFFSCSEIFIMLLF